MDLKLRPEVVQKRQLAMTQQMIKSFQLLQMGNRDLCDYLVEQSLENPVVGMEEPADGLEPEPEELLKKLEWLEDHDYVEAGPSGWDKERIREIIPQIAAADQENLVDYLLRQLDCMALIPREDDVMARRLIAYLDDHGYLEAGVAEIAADLNVPVQNVERALGIVQSLDPSGVGARDLKECLLLQLNELGERDRNLERLIRDFLDELAQNKLDYIGKQLGISVADVQRLRRIISRLNPYPGSAFDGNSRIDYVKVDVAVVEMNGRFAPILNEAACPRLFMEKYYLKIFKATDDARVKTYIGQKVREAGWLMKAIQQRNDTLLNVAGVIVDIQQKFFSGGLKFLVPLTLHDVAEKLSIHESTVSRAIHDKYLESPRGVYKLKYFFSSSTRRDDPGNWTPQVIKMELKEIIVGEDKRRPYSDSQLMALLEQRNIKIARRTVAKYREELGETGASQRKRVSE